MKSIFFMRHVVMWAALAASGVAMAADAAPPAQGSAPGMQNPEGMMGRGMMGQGMMGEGMMDLMRSCQSMMGSGANMGPMGMPKLPPGNEKLETQMHAEMMQKMGEIAARYAARIKETR